MNFWLIKPTPITQRKCSFWNITNLNFSIIICVGVCVGVCVVSHLWRFILIGTINITNVGSEDLSNLNITLNGTSNLAAWPTLWSAPAYLTVNGGPVRRTLGIPGVGQDWWVYAAVLKPGGSLIYNYTLSITNNEPVNITESYSVNKMIEGGSFRINITVQLSSIPRSMFAENQLSARLWMLIDVLCWPIWTILSLAHFCWINATRVKIIFLINTPPLLTKGVSYYKS